MMPKMTTVESTSNTLSLAKSGKCVITSYIWYMNVEGAAWQAAAAVDSEVDVLNTDVDGAVWHVAVAGIL